MEYLENTKTVIKTIVAIVGGLLGRLDISLIVLFIMMGIDMFLGWRIGKNGLSRKTNDGNFSNTVLTKGLDMKVTTLILVSVGYLMDLVMQMNFIGVSITWFYIATELSSISENAAILGVTKVPILNRVVDFLIKMSDKDIE